MARGVVMSTGYVSDSPFYHSINILIWESMHDDEPIRNLSVQTHLWLTVREGSAPSLFRFPILVVHETTE